MMKYDSYCVNCKVYYGPRRKVCDKCKTPLSKLYADGSVAFFGNKPRKRAVYSHDDELV